MTELPPQLLERVVDRLHPRQLYLFGSRARDQSGADSDWDVLVVVDDATTDRQIGWEALHEARWTSFPAANRTSTGAWP